MKSGHVVFTLEYTDDDGDTLTNTITNTDPDPAPFSFSGGKSHIPLTYHPGQQFFSHIGTEPQLTRTD